MTDPKVLNWLLEESNPSVRYFTLRDILGQDDNDSALRATWRGIPTSSLVKKILSKQKSGGYWEDADSPYLPKYKATYWQIMILGQLGMCRTLENVRRVCNYIFRFQHAEGGFTCETSKTALREYKWHFERGEALIPTEEWLDKKIYEGQLSCLTGNLVTALLRLGYGNDQRVKRALEWLVKIQYKDGGWLCPYWTAHAEDTHSCFYGTIGPLEALSEAISSQSPSRFNSAARMGAEFLLMHRLFKADHHAFRVINKRWLKFGFPTFYMYNTLRGLDVLSKLGLADDSRINNALDGLLAKRGQDGTWNLESSPVGRMHANIEPVGKPSKWITMIALRVLKRLGQA
jgi:hypothetical protein